MVLKFNVETLSFDFVLKGGAASEYQRIVQIADTFGARPFSPKTLSQELGSRATPGSWRIGILHRIRHGEYILGDIFQRGDTGEQLTHSLAAATSRLAESRKSTVRPCLSTARYRYVQRPFTFTYVSSQRQEPPTARAYQFQRFSNSGMYRWTHRRIVVCASSILRSPIMLTRSRELSLYVTYHLTQRITTS
jgi:hypothetical protein